MRSGFAKLGSATGVAQEGEPISEQGKNVRGEEQQRENTLY